MVSTIQKDGLALLTRYECRHNRGFRGVNAHADCGGVAVNSFKQTLYLPLAAAQDHDVVGIVEV